MSTTRFKAAIVYLLKHLFDQMLILSMQFMYVGNTLTLLLQIVSVTNASRVYT